MAQIIVSTLSAVSLSGAQTLSNKTITSPIINSILTAATDGATTTLVARNTAAQTQTVLTVVGAATVANSYITAQVGGTWTLASGQTWTLPALTVGGAIKSDQGVGLGEINFGPDGWSSRIFRSDGTYGQTGNSLVIFGYQNVILSTTAGGVGIGLTPTAVLHLKAGTATAATAPLKFTSGTLLTTPEAGAVEWDGTNLFITQTDGTRKTFAYVA